MARKMLIDATHAEETRVVVVDGNKVEEFDFETVNKRQLAGNIYLAKVTRVEPSLQAAFVDYGGNRHGFLAFAEIHPDYYQIPVADRKALIEEERAYQRQQEEEEGRGRRRPPARKPAPKAETSGTGAMDVVDLGEETGADALFEPDARDAPGRPSDADDDNGDAGHDERGDGGNGDGGNGDGGRRTYRAMDHAAEIDDEIESVAEEDVAEEIPEQRRPRPRKYKIQEVIKVRQIMLVQVVKEERGNKGAALTTYLSLAGRYCVLMPNTARGGGISRKITQAADRKKLKEIAGELEVPDGAGLIIRTAGAKRTKAEIKRDYEYLIRLWEQVRELTLKSIAPAPIYEEGNLIKRAIRDLYNREIEEILVEGEAGYRTAKDFMKMIMPSHAKVVQPYHDQVPLFARYQVESYLAGMFNPTVQLKSGGYIVIGVTEALVAIDVNSGRATKEGSIEETALKTNLEAAEEIARQLRLRDLAGLIVIDFIDMEERRNNAAVEKKLKDKLKTDRARIQVGRISGFGLLEMSRQRLRPGMLESTTQPCPHCHGTGLIRSDDSQALAILRALEEEGTRKRSREVLLKAPVGIINFLMNHKREHIAGIELRYGMAVRIEADPAMISPDYVIDKFKTATRVVAPLPSPVVSIESSTMADIEDEEEIDQIDEIEDEDETEESAAGDESETGSANGNGGGKKKRRRRRRRRGGAGGGERSDDRPMTDAEAAAEDAASDDAEDAGAEEPAEPAAAEPAAAEAVVAPEAVAAAEVAAEPEAPAKKRTTRSRTSKAKAAAEPAADAADDAAAEPKATRKASTTSRKRTTKAKTAAQPEPAQPEPAQPEPAQHEPAQPAAAPAIAEGSAAANLWPAAPEPDPAPASQTWGASPSPEVAMPDDAVPAAAAESWPAAPEPAPAPAGAVWPEASSPDPQPAATSGGDKPRKRGWWSIGR
ncbi:MAG: ribonuclease E/G [Gemmobacter sp.]